MVFDSTVLSADDTTFKSVQLGVSVFRYSNGLLNSLGLNSNPP